MAEPSRTTAGHSIADLKTLIKRDLEASNELQHRIEQLRRDIEDGIRPPKKKIDLMEVSNKDMTKELVARIEQIETSDQTATDREMLQALNARLIVCDVQAMRLAELRELELEREAKGEAHQKALLPESTLHRSVSAPDTVEDTTGPGEPIEDLQQGSYYSGEESPDHRHAGQSDDEIESAPDVSEWAAPYRILSIPPETPEDEMDDHIKRAIARLAAKHDPTRLPNDHEAPERWAVIERAREVLSNAERRQFMDRHHKVPAGLEDVDFAKLTLE